MYLRRLRILFRLALLTNPFTITLLWQQREGRCGIGFHRKTLRKAEIVAMEYSISAHARFEMQRRGIDEEMVKQILSKPEQRFLIWGGREVYQSRLNLAGKGYLVRVFVDKFRHGVEVITVYRTSKISKYWRSES